MAKKKLKLKKLGEIKESVKKEKAKKKTTAKEKESKEKKTKKNRHIGTKICMVFITMGIAVASIIIAFGLYIVFTSLNYLLG